MIVKAYQITWIKKSSVSQWSGYVNLSWTCHCCVVICFFFFKQKTAYDISECDWSSDVCSSDLIGRAHVCTPVTFRNLVCRLLLEIGRASCRERVLRLV